MDRREEEYILKMILKNAREEEKDIQSEYKMNYFCEEDEEKKEILNIQQLLAIYILVIIEDLIYKSILIK